MQICFFLPGNGDVVFKDGPSDGLVAWRGGEAARVAVEHFVVIGESLDQRESFHLDGRTVCKDATSDNNAMVTHNDHVRQRQQEKLVSQSLDHRWCYLVTIIISLHTHPHALHTHSCHFYLNVSVVCVYFGGWGGVDDCH